MKTFIFYPVCLLFVVIFGSCDTNSHRYRSSFVRIDEKHSALIYNCENGIITIDSTKIQWSSSHNRLYIPLLVTDDGGFAEEYPRLILDILDSLEKNIIAPKYKIISWRSEIDGSGIWIDLEPEKPATLVWQNLTASDTIDMPYGGSLNKTLSMTNAQALEFAKRFKKDYWYTDDGRLFVKVSPGLYVKDWRPIEVGKVSWGMLVGEYMSSAPK